MISIENTGSLFSFFPYRVSTVNICAYPVIPDMNFKFPVLISFFVVSGAQGQANYRSHLQFLQLNY